MKGAGKSFLIRARETYRRIKYPKTNGLILRKTFPELLSNHIRKFFQEYPPVINWYNKGEKRINWPNGSMTEFSFLKNTDDVYTYQGREYDDISIDEITQHEEEVFKILRSSLRTTTKGLKPTMFLTGNPGGIGHCVPYGEVLTPEGWKEISKIGVGEWVATDVGGKTKFVRVDQKIEEDYVGKFCVSANWSARFICTPDHCLPIVTETKNKLGRTFHSPVLRKVRDFKEVTRLPKVGVWDGRRIEKFEIANTETREKKVEQPLSIKGDDYCELMGWFLSEGYTMKKLGYWGISQSKSDNKIKIQSLLDRCGFRYKWNGCSACVYSRSWTDYFSVFGKCRDKFIPRILKEAPPDQLLRFWKTAMLGDGHAIHYYTVSKRLADDMCEIGLKMGKRVYLSSRQRKNRQGLLYDISFKPNKLGWIEKNKITEIEYVGKIYCLGVNKYHTFYLRQNGTIFLSGNSWVKRLFIDRQFIPGERPEDFAFIPAFLKDNWALMEADPDYIRRLQDLPEDKRRAYLEGDWTVFSGQCFSEWRTASHVVPRFAPKTSIPIYLSFDWGFNAPFACYAHVLVDLKTASGLAFKRLYTFREWYGKERHPAVWAEIIYDEMKKYKINTAYCDPSMFNRKADGSRSISAEFEDVWTEKNGEWWASMEGGSRDRLKRIALTHRWFSLAPDGLPYWQICDSCPNFIRTVPMLTYDENRIEDINSSGDDHSWDSTSYLIGSLSYTPQYIGGTLTVAREKSYVVQLDDTGQAIQEDNLLTAFENAAV